MKSAHKLLIFILWIFSVHSLYGCDSIQEVNGSFEESVKSGRATSFVQDQDSRRFFRFHLRQFDDAIGGTFETFDLKDYSLFSQMPEIMNTVADYYYCGRIEYGYVRNDRIYVTFRDKEQREWQFTAELGEKTLSGSLSRIQNNLSLTGDATLLDYYLPEDRAFLTSEENTPSDANQQLVLQAMDKSSDRSLDCLYYYKSRKIEFVLPNDILKSCLPSEKRCDSIKLAIIGKSPQHNDEFNLAGLQTVLTSRLDDIDIENLRIRSVNLRENPYAFHGRKVNELFIATAILFRDLNRDDDWDFETEPVLATLNHQILVFLPSALESDISGRNFEGKLYPEPVFTPDSNATSGGWYVYHDSSEENETAWRTLKKTTLEQEERLVLVEFAGEPSNPDDEQGCFVAPASDSQKLCTGILPVLLN